MNERLEAEELLALVRRVFRPRAADRGLAVLVDLPDRQVADNPAWSMRRQLAAAWATELAKLGGELGLEVRLALYRNVRSNNADLPPIAWLHRGGKLPRSADELDPKSAVPMDRVFFENSILLAPTEFSATAPLKVLAREHGFRAATMPGFTTEMIPALRLDYQEISRRVEGLKALLDRAEEARLHFLVDGQEEHRLVLDLRHRTAHASTGLLPEPGMVGNLPSGEAYIVPYEGERGGDPRRSAGELPVQFGNGVVVYRVEGNRAVAVEGPAAAEVLEREARLLREEPAYGNLAELGLGVLADFGVEPCGEILLDEKLGLHIAFGRSDHFGGQVGPGRFSRPEAVVHIDRVYIPALQPRIAVPRVELFLDDGQAVMLMRAGRYLPHPV